MTDKITFYLNNSNNSDLDNGSFVIYENDNLVDDPTPASLYATLDDITYKIGPNYTEEIKDLILKDKEVQNAIGTQILNIVGNLGLLNVIKTQDEEDPKLNFKIAEGLPQTITDNDNISLTTTQLQDGVEEGTFIAGNKTIKIGGLKSMAYEDADDYIPAEYCPLKQSSDDGEGGEGGA